MTLNERPLITFALFSYNQERFIREAVKGAFSQTYTPLEIILSDDCSTDGTFSIMKEMVAEYEGPHSIILNRNKINMGLCRHFNHILARAAGEIIVGAAGDDISLPNRTKDSWEILHCNPDATCVSFQSIIIDTDGRPTKPEHMIKLKPCYKIYTIKDYLSMPGFHLNGASRAFRKSVHTTFGPLHPMCGTEDSTTFLRCLMMGSAHTCDKVCIYYRVHGNNLSAGGNVHDFKLKPIFRQYIKDIKYACCVGILSDPLAKQLKQKLKINFLRRRLEAAFYQSNFSADFTLLKIIYSNAFTVKEKIHIIYTYFRKYFKK